MIRLERGFTIFEILIVMALIGMIAGLGIGIGMSTYRREIFSSQVNTVVGLLHAARNRAMNNLYQSAHGVRIETDNFVLYYDDGTSDIPRSNLITATGDDEVLFEQLSGAVDSDKEILLQGDAKTARISVSENGKIEWAYE